MLRSLVLVVLTIVCASSAVAAGLKVGVSVDYPPLVYKLEGRVVGIDADNITAVSKIIDREMTVVEMPFTRLIPALKSGEIDIIMSGMSITPERSKEVTFTDSYLDVGQMAILHTSKAAKFGKPWSIYGEGVRVGVEPGTTGAIFVERELTEAKIDFFSNPQAAFAGLRSGVIDIYIHDAPTSWLLATTDGADDLISMYHPLTQESLAWAVRKQDGRLAATLNSALASMKANGTLRFILNRWIPVTVEVN